MRESACRAPLGLPDPRSAYDARMASAATLHFRRSKAYVDSGSAYRVWMDGRRVGKIRNGRELTLPVESGTHQLELRLWAWSSPALTLQLEAGDRVELACEPIDADRPMAVFSRMVTARKHYMDLRQA